MDKLKSIQTLQAYATGLAAQSLQLELIDKIGLANWLTKQL